MKIRDFIVLAVLITIMVIIAALSIMGGPSKAQAREERCLCHNVLHNPVEVCSDDDSYKQGHQSHLNSGFDSYGHCPIPTSTPTRTPTATPTVTPTSSPTPIPTITPTPEPTIIPCEKDCEVTPTPSPEPTPEPKKETGGGWSPSPWTPGPYSPPVCSGTYTDKPLLQHFVRVDPTSVELGWWAPVGGVDKYSLVYGYYGEPMNMGVVYIPQETTRFVIHDLQANRPINAQLWAWKGECVTLSDTIDP